jgi:SAM-dependent methyltransferase
VLANVERTWRVKPETNRDLGEYLLYRRHLFAYETACLKAEKWRTAVDIACGLGYGLPLLGQGGAQVIAIDIAETALRALPDLPFLRRVQSDAANLPLASGSVDLLVGFQLLEHVATPTAVRILTEVRRVLAPGGSAFLTTPNGALRLLWGQKPWNPFHVVEYRPSQIANLCRRVGLPAAAVQGVVGLHGAQEVEMDRVRPNPSHFPGRGLRARMQRMWSRFRAFRQPASRLDPSGRVLREHEASEWFTLTSDYRKAIDFWIEIKG